MGLDNLQNLAYGQGIFSVSLAGHTARTASKVLLENWRAALRDGSDINLVDHVDQVIGELNQFKALAQEHLPLKNGGLGGQTAQYWLDKLDEIGISVYEAEDMPGVFGFTGCDADNYNSEMDATIAAVNANQQQLEEAGLHANTSPQG